MTLPPAKNTPRRKAARQHSSSSSPKLMCRARFCSGLKPSRSTIRRSLAPSVIWNTSLPVSPASGVRSNRALKARWNSLGSRAARAGLPVMIRTSPALKVLQYSRMP